jgi:hypothetical protein
MDLPPGLSLLHRPSLLSVESALDYARATVALIRYLMLIDGKIRYQDLGRTIGMIPPDEKWHIRWQMPITYILCLVAAIEENAGTLDFWRVVTEDGEPGKGYSQNTLLVRDARAIARDEAA